MSIPAPARARRGRAGLLAAALLVALVVAALVSAGTGQLSASPVDVLATLLKQVGIDIGVAPQGPNVEAALTTIRFPRVIMAVLIGAALAVAGLLMQAIFGNPLAEPGVVGVSSGAAVGACSAIVFNLTFFGAWTVPVLAFGAGLAVTLLVYALSRAGGRTEVVTLLLTGIALNAFCGALLALLTFLGDTAAREQIVFWQLGSLNGSLQQQVLIVLPFVAVGVLGAAFLSRRLDLLTLGEKNARHLGVNVEALRVAAIVLTALLVGAAVAFAGIIAFVGLVIPHLMRMVLGPAHRPLLITSVLGGALLLTLADLIARTAVPFADLPIGMLTSLVGGPFFFWLLRRSRKRSGGWG
ncbi:FecCD family ABC transporter permease [Arenivirga flava]|uniref:ABC transporter permease n=1 Tax=Arenivirga flava TaxID=1930060 RepID=A0AA37UGN9_9MICO|nr:iron ABC transporter permease [Arenivirga flava]GMA29125.1 ABC transporter permease [Arenivirga flava]